MNKLIGRGKTDIEVKRDLPQSSNQLCEDDELLLHVRILLRTYGIEQAHQICFLIGKSDTPVAQIQRFGDRKSLISKPFSSFPQGFTS